MADKERFEHLRSLSPVEAAWLDGDFGLGDEPALIEGIRKDKRIQLATTFRSLSEQSIDGGLSTHQGYHEYERLANVPEHLVPDLTVYTADRHPVFIEFWGMMDDPMYQQRRLRKCEVYARHRCTLIELY